MFSINSIAQSIEYTYDNAGNRIARKIIPAQPEQVQQENEDSTEVNEDETKNPEVYEDFIAKQELKIYPNPTRGKLKIEMVNYNADATGTIQVYDLSGRLVLNLSTIQQSMEIDITSQPAGQYIMIIVIDQQKSEWKIIKQ